MRAGRIGAGEGCNLNLPLEPGAGDAEVTAATRAAVRAALDFGAKALVVAPGFDSLPVLSDCLAEFLTDFA